MSEPQHPRRLKPAAARDTDTPHRCTEQHATRGADAQTDEGPMFFSAGEYVAGAVTFLVLMAVGLILHLSGHRLGAEGATTGSVVMSVAVIPAGIVMALMERRRTTPTGSKETA